MANPDDPTRSLKINDHHSPYYARKFEKEFPEHADIFRTRKTKSEKEDDSFYLESSGALLAIRLDNEEREQR